MHSMVRRSAHSSIGDDFAMGFQVNEEGSESSSMANPTGTRRDVKPALRNRREVRVHSALIFSTRSFMLSAT
jgi:hypothetical protein